MTQPSSFGAEVDAAIQAAIVPTPADVMTARSIALELGERGADAPLTSDVLDVWLQRLHGLRLATAPPQISIEREELRWIPPDRDVPGLVKIRGTAAVSTAIAQLIADGLLTKVYGNQYREDIDRHVGVTHSGGSNNVNYSAARLSPASSRPSRRPLSLECLPPSGRVMVEMGQRPDAQNWICAQAPAQTAQR